MTILLFAHATDLAGAKVVDLAPTPTVGELRRVLARQVPALAALLPRCRIAVNQDFADDDTPLSPSDEIAVIPPVSGG